MMNKPESIDAYIASFPVDVQVLLNQMRQAIKQVAPDADELISYGIPAFRFKKMLVWFAAHTNHIGLYPRGSGIEEFAEQLKGYKVSKGTIQFPLDKPLPVELIQKIVQFRVEENLRKGRK
jgi:uncharacterized protein YdhG (YjbR/CyaY superfamily)